MVSVMGGVSMLQAGLCDGLTTKRTRVLKQARLDLLRVRYVLCGE